MDSLTGLHCAELSGISILFYWYILRNLTNYVPACITFLLFPFWTYHKLGIPNRVVDRASKIVGLIQDGNPIDRISTNNVKLKEVSYKVCFTIVYLLQKIHVLN